MQCHSLANVVIIITKLLLYCLLCFAIDWDCVGFHSFFVARRDDVSITMLEEGQWRGSFWTNSPVHLAGAPGGTSSGWEEEGCFEGVSTPLESMSSRNANTLPKCKTPRIYLEMPSSRSDTTHSRLHSALSQSSDSPFHRFRQLSLQHTIRKSKEFHFLYFAPN